ncbi:hypothetical protein HC928_07450, partial [bacterium]|nr:hypothetical protein [bacterium]
PTASATSKPTATATATAVPATATDTPVPATPTPTATPVPATPTPTATATSEPTMTGTATPTNTTVSTVTATSTATATSVLPQLQAHPERGAPGSAFTFTGTGLDPMSLIRIVVNGQPLAAQLRTNTAGMVQFVLHTPTQASVGTYTVRIEHVTETEGESTLFVQSRYILIAAAPLVPPDQEIPVHLHVSAAVQPVQSGRLWLPIVVRGQ